MAREIPLVHPGFIHHVTHKSKKPLKSTTYEVCPKEPCESVWVAKLLIYKGALRARRVPKKDVGNAMGFILYEEWLQPLGITQYKLAHDIEVDARRINAICNGTRAITEDTALLLGEYFGVDGASFLNLQSHYDLERARKKLSAKLLRVRRRAYRAEV